MATGRDVAGGLMVSLEKVERALPFFVKVSNTLFAATNGCPRLGRIRPIGIPQHRLVPLFAEEGDHA